MGNVDMALGIVLGLALAGLVLLAVWGFRRRTKVTQRELRGWFSRNRP